MIDRFGRPVVVGWPRHHILWIRAAMSLDGQERREAIQDIADMTGRSYACVWAMQSRIRERDKKLWKRQRLCQLAERWAAE